MQAGGDVHDADLKAIDIERFVIKRDLKTVNRREGAEVGEAGDLKSGQAGISDIFVDRKGELHAGDRRFGGVDVREARRLNAKNGGRAVGEVEDSGNREPGEIDIGDIADHAEIKSVKTSVLAPKQAGAHAGDVEVARRELQGWQQADGQR